MSGNSNSLKMFISYSHADEQYLEQLKPHLATLKKSDTISEWCDKKLLVGDKLDEEILEHLSSSDIVAFLVSSDFLDSYYCYDIELSKALERFNEKKNRIVPIIIRNCTWQDSIFGNYLAIPKDGKPISTYTNKDEAWVEVVKSIKKVAEVKFNNKKTNSKSERKGNIELNTDFSKYLEDTEVIFQHKNKINIQLSDLFVYPDLSVLKVQKKEFSTKMNSDFLLNDEELNNSLLILGDDQSGKTALIKRVFFNYYSKGIYPVVFHGEDINVSNVDRLKNKFLKKQYTFSDFNNIDVLSNRILIIDDFDKVKLNVKFQKDLILNCLDRFDKIIIFSDNSIKYEESRFINFSNFEHYELKPFGNIKRNELINKWNSLGRVETIDAQELQELNDKITIDINSIIRKNVLPPKPIYILTLLQLLESTKKIDYSLTSYGHCYQSIIHSALKSVSIIETEFDSFINYLTELAYFIYSNKTDQIDNEQLILFQEEYSINYVISNHDMVINKLIKARIITSNGVSIKFNYKYIFYFYTAKYISDNLNEPEGKKVIEFLCNNMHIEKFANILIFIVHHSKDTFILEEILLNTLVIFDKIEPATLSKEEMGFLAGFIQEIPDIVYEHKTIDAERTKVLELRDEIEEAIEEDKDSNSEVEHVDENIFSEINKSLRAVEIIGQILRNRYGSIKRPQLLNLTNAAYDSGLKLLNFFLMLSNFEKDGIIEFIEKMITENPKAHEEEITRKARNIFLMLCYGASYGILKKISSSLGSEQLLTIFEQVCRDKPESPAIKLLYIAIKMEYQKKIPRVEIKELNNELKSNPITQRLLKEIIIQHLYLNHVGFEDRNWISSTLEIPMDTQRALQVNKEIIK